MSEQPSSPTGMFVVRYIASGLTLTPVILMVVLLFLRIQGKVDEGGSLDLDSTIETVVSLALVGAGVLICGVSLLVRQSLAANSAPGREGIQARLQAMIIGYGIAEGAAILGFVWGFLSGTIVIPLLLATLTMMTGIRHFPTKAWMEGESLQGDE